MECARSDVTKVALPSGVRASGMVGRGGHNVKWLHFHSGGAHITVNDTGVVIRAKDDCVRARALQLVRRQLDAASKLASHDSALPSRSDYVLTEDAFGADPWVTFTQRTGEAAAVTGYKDKLFQLARSPCGIAASIDGDGQMDGGCGGNGDGAASRAGGHAVSREKVALDLPSMTLVDFRRTGAEPVCDSRSVRLPGHEWDDISRTQCAGTASGDAASPSSGCIDSPPLRDLDHERDQDLLQLRQGDIATTTTITTRTTTTQRKASAATASPSGPAPDATAAIISSSSSSPLSSPDFVACSARFYAAVPAAASSAAAASVHGPAVPSWLSGCPMPAGRRLLLAQAGAALAEAAQAAVSHRPMYDSMRLRFKLGKVLFRNVVQRACRYPMSLASLHTLTNAGRGAPQSTFSGYLTPSAVPRVTSWLTEVLGFSLVERKTSASLHVINQELNVHFTVALGMERHGDDSSAVLRKVKAGSPRCHSVSLLSGPEQLDLRVKLAAQYREHPALVNDADAQSTARRIVAAVRSEGFDGFCRSKRGLPRNRHLEYARRKTTAVYEGMLPQQAADGCGVAHRVRISLTEVQDGQGVHYELSGCLPDTDSALGQMLSWRPPVGGSFPPNVQRSSLSTRSPAASPPSSSGGSAANGSVNGSSIHRWGSGSSGYSWASRRGSRWGSGGGSSSVCGGSSDDEDAQMAGRWETARSPPGGGAGLAGRWGDRMCSRGLSGSGAGRGGQEEGGWALAALETMAEFLVALNTVVTESAV